MSSKRKNPGARTATASDVPNTSNVFLMDSRNCKKLMYWKLSNTAKCRVRKVAVFDVFQPIKVLDFLAPLKEAFDVLGKAEIVAMRSRAFF